MTPACDACGVHARELHYTITHKVLCEACWRVLVRGKGETPPKAGTLNHAQAAQRQLTFSEVSR